MKPSLRLKYLDPGGTLFSHYTALSKKHASINLGQGFPSIKVADFIRKAASDAVSSHCVGHQYTRSEGHPRLVKALAEFYTPKIGRALDPITEIMSCVGASQAIYTATQAYINPGDEVVIMQPFYDAYPASVRLAGGIPILISLKASLNSDWILDLAELRDAINVNTKIIILNNPNNPVGKVWSREELLQIAEIAKQNDLLVIADEVYETLIYSDSKSQMIKFASLPGMFERTITVGSMGKMFGVTGWKIGWIIAPAEIVRSVWLIHQFIAFCVVHPLQEAGGDALVQAAKNTYFDDTIAVYQRHRDYLFKKLEQLGFKPIMPNAGYFIVCDVSSLKGYSSDSDFSTYLTTEVGVTSIPIKAFYDVRKAEGMQQFVRFAFCKEMSMLEEACRRLQAHFE